MTQRHRYPIGFRAQAKDPVIYFSAPQHRRLAGYFSDNRDVGRKVYKLEITLETRIEQPQARITEMQSLGFDIRSVSPEGRAKGDRRHLYYLASSVLLVWEELENDGDGGGDVD